MKINKVISRALTLGFLLNSLSILSYANTEIPNRYQTLEGEYITIDDSTEGNLEEIEIFGNTVQKSNNLEDIQSVGDLYVDDEGIPILDKQGREQYKIDIFSNGKNLFDGNLEIGDIHNITGEKINSNICVRSSNYIQVKEGSIITLSNNMGYANYIYEYDADKKFIKYTPNLSTNTVTLSNDTKYILFRSIKSRTENNLNVLYLLEISELLTEYEEYQTYKTTILLPCQLQKIGSITDKLYWDSSRGKYIIKKNITSVVFDASEDEQWKYTTGIYSDIYEHFFITLNTSDFKEGIPGHGRLLLSDRFLCSNDTWINGPHSSITTSNSSYFQVGMTFDMSYYKNLNEFKNWLKTNPTTVWYQLKTPELVETNITSKLKIPTYNEKTHIYVNLKNGINPALKVTIDRLPQIAKDTVSKANTDSNIYNVSLARMYVNMLPESLYKDQLQEQLNNILNLNEMTLEKKKVTSNLDLYIKSENVLIMSLNTNSITFDDFSGVEDITKENAVQISISSSLPYTLNAYLPTEIQSSDKSNIIDKAILNIKENGETTYQAFKGINEKMLLKDNNPAGNYLSHGIDIQLKGNISHQKDVYKTTIKFEAKQK